MPQPKTRRQRRGSWKSASTAPFEFPEAVRRVLDEDDSALTAEVATGLMRARAADQDIADPAVAEWVVAAARAEVAGHRAQTGWDQLVTAT